MTADRREVIAGLTGPGGMFEVADAVVGGRAMRVWGKAPATLRDVLLGTQRHGDRDYLVYGDERLTCGDHLALAGGLARWLADERGVGKGDRVAIAMRNYPEWIVAFWATQALGAVAVPLNAWWTGPELRFGLADSGASLAFVDGERYERMEADFAALGVSAVVVRHDGPVVDEALHWADVIAALDPTPELPSVDLGPDDDATIVYTSGTTGEPKGAIS